MSVAYLALGSNLGNRVQNLREALAAFPPLINVVSISPVYETEPQYVKDQLYFYNAAIKVHTELRPRELLLHLKHIEEKIGRTPTVPNGPRLIDLDILLYDDVVMSSPTLTIPHPRMHERAFVLSPLADIAPNVLHPVLRKEVRELLGALTIPPGEIEKTNFTL